MKFTISIAAGCILLGACSQLSGFFGSEPIKDGGSALPRDYGTWPKMFTAAQRPDAKQVREIFIEPKADRTKAGESFPDGTRLVMENYSAKVNSDGSLATGPDGLLVKGALVRIFVMEKVKGSGRAAPEGLKNGDWIYTAFAADGAKSNDNLVACRTCHLPLGEKKDFVQRYDEYFQQRAAPPAHG